MPVVIEEHDATGAKWGVSLAGSNPLPEEFIPCASREEAFSLKARIETPADPSRCHVITDRLAWKQCPNPADWDVYALPTDPYVGEIVCSEHLGAAVGREAEHFTVWPHKQARAAACFRGGHPSTRFIWTGDDPTSGLWACDEHAAAGVEQLKSEGHPLARDIGAAPPLQ